MSLKPSNPVLHDIRNLAIHAVAILLHLHQYQDRAELKRNLRLDTICAKECEIEKLKRVIALLGTNSVRKIKLFREVGE